MADSMGSSSELGGSCDIRGDTYTYQGFCRDEGPLGMVWSATVYIASRPVLRISGFLPAATWKELDPALYVQHQVESAIINAMLASAPRPGTAG